MIVGWPHFYLAQEAAGRVDERTALVVLTHNPKFETPLLDVGLRSPGVAFRCPGTGPELPRPGTRRTR